MPVLWFGGNLNSPAFEELEKDHGYYPLPSLVKLIKIIKVQFTIIGVWSSIWYLKAKYIENCIIYLVKMTAMERIFFANS